LASNRFCFLKSDVLNLPSQKTKMIYNKFKKTGSIISREELRRRKREGFLILVIIGIVALLTIFENNFIQFGTDLPVSNTILMFILINFNLLLLILLIFLVFRNLVKLFYDRKNNAAGAKLRTRLVIAFIALTLLPTIILFFFSINFITTSIEFWFNVPIEQALENSLTVGRRLYQYTEEKNGFFIKRIANEVKKKDLLKLSNKNDLSNYIQVVQKVLNLHAVEIYDVKANRITFAASPDLENSTFRLISADYFQKEMDETGIRTVSENTGKGEIIKTIGTIPFEKTLSEAEAFVVLSILTPQSLADNMEAISKGVEEYRQIKLLKKPIQITYYIALSIVALLVVFCAIWFGFYLAKSITIPIMELAEGTRRVADGDLSFSIAMVADDEIGTLVDSFNKMTKDLRIGRDQLEASARILKDQNIEIEKRRQYMEIVLENISAGVIAISSSGLVSNINKSAEKMLKLQAGEIINKSFKTILEKTHVYIPKEILDKLANPPNETASFPLRLTINNKLRSFMVHVNSLQDETGRHLGIVMVFDDLTNLEKAQRMAAWREVARRIAHEVKNPLTPISLSAQRLKRKYSEKINEPVFDECTKMIIDHVDLIRNLVNEFSAFAKFPTANPKPCELLPIIEETVGLYREGHPHIHFDICTIDHVPLLNLDRQQIKQAMLNLVANAVGALDQHGEIIITLAHDPILKKVRIEVADNGFGVPDEDKIRLFEPNFSTKKAGMGLGLTIVNTIISDHNGMITVHDNHPKGAKFVIELPAINSSNQLV
jgi:two-component system nitrogen regulation sensor histidine kinase NtrY